MDRSVWVLVGVCGMLVVDCGKSGAKVADVDAGVALRPVTTAASAGDAGHDGDPFEGIVSLSVPGGTGTSHATFEVKGGKSRWAFNAPGDASAYRVYDAKSRSVFTVWPKQESVTREDLPPVGAFADAGVPWTFSTSAPGRVAELPCKRFTAKSDDNAEFTVCTADALPIPLQLALPELQLPFSGALEARGELPLAVTVQVLGRARRPPVPRLLTTEARRTPIDDARFVIPDYPVTERRDTVPMRPLPR